jgi:hypothetical protein
MKRLKGGLGPFGGQVAARSAHSTIVRKRVPLNTPERGPRILTLAFENTGIGPSGSLSTARQSSGSTKPRQRVPSFPPRPLIQQYREHR